MINQYQGYTIISDIFIQKKTSIRNPHLLHQSMMKFVAPSQNISIKVRDLRFSEPGLIYILVQ